jgi:hypothetical protein
VHEVDLPAEGRPGESFAVLVRAANAVLLRALAKRREDRFQGGCDLAAAVAKAIRESGSNTQ